MRPPSAKPELVPCHSRDSATRPKSHGLSAKAHPFAAQTLTVQPRIAHRMLEHGFVVNDCILRPPAEEREFLRPFQVVPRSHILAGLAPLCVRQFAIAASGLDKLALQHQSVDLGDALRGLKRLGAVRHIVIRISPQRSQSLLDQFGPVLCRYGHAVYRCAKLLHRWPHDKQRWPSWSGIPFPTCAPGQTSLQSRRWSEHGLERPLRTDNWDSSGIPLRVLRTRAGPNDDGGAHRDLRSVGWIITASRLPGWRRSRNAREWARERGLVQSNNSPRRTE